MNVLALLRAPQFSPNAVEKDRAIMMAVAERLRGAGCRVDVLSEEQHPQSTDASVVLSMGRRPETLTWLKGLKARVVNTAEAVMLCNDRCALAEVMRQQNILLPPDESEKGWWLKRSDGCTQTADDVVYVADEDALQRAVRAFEARGISRYLVQSHVEGDHLKFYGVRTTGFFRSHLVPPHPCTPATRTSHLAPRTSYPVPPHLEAERLAAAIGLDVYGGDCIVTADGTCYMIDFNDWPSFSCCRDEAADAILRLLNF